jgi:hypothetical protein
MHRIHLVALVLLLSLPGAAAAQPQASPLAGHEGAIEGLTRSSLDAALSARQSCQSLVRLINDLGGKWQLMRKGDLARRSYLDAHQDARVEWDIRWGACAGARRDLRDGMPRGMLDHEVQMLKRIWQGINSVSEALMDDMPAVQINKTAAVYERALAQWSSDLEDRSSFWAGKRLVTPDLDEGCVGQTERAQQELAVQLMTTASRSIGTPTPETLSALQAALGEADEIRRRCKHESPLEEIELQLLTRSMRSYRRLFEALTEKNDATIRAAMISAQEVTSRLTRCRQEHGSGGTISPSCTPQ